MRGCVNEKSIHTGHRQRMRDRLKKSSAQGLETHELLEMLLYYTNPRKNTNELAHKLINEYGSLEMLFDAEIADLERRSEVSESTAVFFALVSEFIRRYNGEKWKPRKVIDSSDIAGEYCKFLLSYEKRECFYVICLDSQCKLISSALISIGTVNETHVYTRNVVESALKFNARSIILAHNHPGGSLVPTTSDVETTINIIKVLNMIDILVADHIIVAGNGYISMSDKGLIRNLDDV
ncbi:MAG TPA: hypothetical protein DIC60_03785 [Lachnospiraceae bacterium]|nr:hypothetical protein [Lachnospiraceae bacterium]